MATVTAIIDGTGSFGKLAIVHCTVHRGGTWSSNMQGGAAGKSERRPVLESNSRE